jgi:mRNA interferase YafQ
MYQIRMTKTFRKDTERCRKRGCDMELLKTAIRLLEASGKLPESYRPHKLSGNYGGCWECHLKADWLMIWEQNDTELTLLFTGTGTHSSVLREIRRAICARICSA